MNTSSGTPRFFEAELAPVGCTIDYGFHRPSSACYQLIDVRPATVCTIRAVEPFARPLDCLFARTPSLDGERWARHVCFCGVRSGRPCHLQSSVNERAGVAQRPPEPQSFTGLSVLLRRSSESRAHCAYGSRTSGPGLCRSADSRGIGPDRQRQVRCCVPPHGRRSARTAGSLRLTLAIAPPLRSRHLRFRRTSCAFYPSSA